MAQVAIMDFTIKPGKVSGKSVLVACTLCLLGGFFGIHRFYLGKKISGGVIILVTIFGFLTVYLVIGVLVILIVTVWTTIDMAWIALSVRRKKPLIKRELTESGYVTLLSPLVCFLQVLAKFLAIRSFWGGKLVCCIIIPLLAVSIPTVIDFDIGYFYFLMPALVVATGMISTILLGFFILGIVLVLIVIDSVRICRSVRQAAQR